MSRGKSLDGWRDSRVWLGPPGQGGERLARLFGLPAERDVWRKLADLQASVSRLEEELRKLTRSPIGAGSNVSEPSLAEPQQSLPSIIELPRVLLRATAITGFLAASSSPSMRGNAFSEWWRECGSSRVSIGLISSRCAVGGRQLLLVPVDDVEVVQPEERAIVLNPPVASRASASACDRVSGSSGCRCTHAFTSPGSHRPQIPSAGLSGVATGQ
jgi:hypothetical protein